MSIQPGPQPPIPAHAEAIPELVDAVSPKERTITFTVVKIGEKTLKKVIAVDSFKESPSDHVDHENS